MVGVCVGVGGAVVGGFVGGFVGGGSVVGGGTYVVSPDGNLLGDDRSGRTVRGLLLNELRVAEACTIGFPNGRRPA